MTGIPDGTDLLGLAAGALVLLTFLMQSMLWLRLVAVASNACFIAYGLSVGLMPIWLLHVVLLPVNIWRLWCFASEDSPASRNPCERLEPQVSIPTPPGIAAARLRVVQTGQRPVPGQEQDAAIAACRPVTSGRGRSA